MCCGSVADLQHNASVAAFIGLPSPPNIILCKKETKETNLKKNKATPNKGGRFQFGCDPSRAAGHPRSPAGGRYVENANSRARDAGGAALGRDPPTPSPGNPPTPGPPGHQCSPGRFKLGPTGIMEPARGCAALCTRTLSPLKPSTALFPPQDSFNWVAVC